MSFGSNRRNRKAREQLPPAPLPSISEGPQVYQPLLDDSPSEEDHEGSLGQFFWDLLQTILLGVVIFVGVRSLLQSTKVISSSMEPTLRVGQFLMVNKLAYELGDPQRKEIAVFHSPVEPGVALIKRVIGLPGEEISIRNNQVFVDGYALDEPYLVEGTRMANWGPLRLEPGQYLMLGDNRANSNDSRYIGPIDREAFIGKAWFSIWPPGLLH